MMKILRMMSNIFVVGLSVSFLIYITWNELIETRIIYVERVNDNYVYSQHYDVGIDDEIFIGEGFEPKREYSVNIQGFGIPSLGIYRHITEFENE